MAQRFDISPLGKVERTPQGGVRVPANLTRVGVFPYRDSAGNEWNEYRPASEVFNPASLATLRGATVTDLHPSDGMVHAGNFKRLSVGHVHDDVRADGPFVAATVSVNDADEVKLIDAGQRKDLSCGYECQVAHEPGVFDGVPYARVQKDIRYNHVGLGPEGWGRAGSQVALRIDAADAAVRVGDAPATTTIPTARTDAAAAHTNASKESPMTVATKKLTVGKRTLDIRTDDDMAPVQGAIDDQAKTDADAAAGAQALCDAVQKALADAMSQNAQLKGQLVAAQATAAQPPAITEDIVPDDVLDSAIAKRETLRASARKVLGADAKLDGQKPAEIKRAVIAKAFPSTKMDALDAKTTDLLFSTAADHAGSTDAADAANAAARAAAAGARPETKTDAAGAKPGEVRTDGSLEDAQKSLHERLMELGRSPLAAHGKVA